MLKGGRPDRLPLMPITMMFAADRLGVKYSEYARNHEVLVKPPDWAIWAQAEWNDEKNQRFVARLSQCLEVIPVSAKYWNREKSYSYLS
jgi:hypothetical protein